MILGIISGVFPHIFCIAASLDPRTCLALYPPTLRFALFWIFLVADMTAPHRTNMILGIISGVFPHIFCIAASLDQELV
jgi:hypothetical protein